MSGFCGTSSTIIAQILNFKITYFLKSFCNKVNKYNVLRVFFILDAFE